MATPENVFQQLYPYLWWAGEDVAAQTILHCVHAASQKAFCHLMLNDAASAKAPHCLPLIGGSLKS